ncbi:MAG: DNA-protecting protein DprA [Phycisphaerae bacterium]|nr:DNA-protecting protein DprA [Phycisphaerae bacterium]
MSDVDQNMVLKWLGLHLTDQVGSKTIGALLEHFGSIDAIYEAKASEMTRIPGISQKKAIRIIESRRDDKAQEELALAAKLGVKIIHFDHEDYPDGLKRINDRPYVIYVKGTLVRQDKLAIAMVGSRSCSHYGMEQAGRLSHLLASAGFTVVSGLARGIDTAAHRGALAAKGRTIAVQGRGLAGVYPPENKDLANEIRQSGAVVSELPLTFEPISNNFPARNRIIAGLTLGTVVVEARRRSGAAITARLAMEYEREVMAVPGPIDSPGSETPHRLIRDGARLVEGIDDILEAIGYLGNDMEKYADAKSKETIDKVEATTLDYTQLNLPDDELTIISNIDKHPVHIDQLIKRTKLNAGQVNAAVTKLQLKGLIKQLPGNYFKAKTGI